MVVGETTSSVRGARVGWDSPEVVLGVEPGICPNRGPRAITLLALLQVASADVFVGETVVYGLWMPEDKSASTIHPLAWLLECPSVPTGR